MTATTNTAGRIIDTSIEIDAPIEDVWNALATAEGLMNWFPPEARVKPGPGGSVWFCWGEQQQWEVPIDVWEPKRRLRLIYMEPTPPDEIEAARAAGLVIPHRMAVDYHLEDRGGRTVLRLVQSGFGTGEPWDTQYDGTVSGWAYQLGGLKHSLERHRGVTRRLVRAKRVIDDGAERQAWEAVTGPQALDASAALAGKRPGDRFAFTTAGGDELSGVVHAFDPPDFRATTDAFNDAYLRLMVQPACLTQPQGEVSLWLSVYGVDDAACDALEQRLQEMMDGLDL